MSRLSQWCAWLSVALMLAAWVCIELLGDRVWWTLPLLYGPRWAAGALFAGLLPALLWARPSAVKAGLVMTPFFVFGLLDVRVPYGNFDANEALPVRIMELNSGGGVRGQREGKVSSILAELERSQPQFVVIAECNSSISDALKESGDWYVRSSNTRLCFASRWEVTQWEVRDPKDIWKMKGSGAIARATIATPGGALRVGLVHLETPREALEEFMDLSNIPTLGEQTRKNIAQRELESMLAREWIFAGDKLPTIVAGDFNLPVESAIYRRHWSDLRNAFSRSGFGTGYSKQTSFWGSRIDHILTTSDIVAEKAWTAASIGSDHLPVFADLTLPMHSAL
ncbi:MAG: endonuclease/exonuclease/phosphatase family protein [Pseudomonadota bacterium]